MAETKKWVVHVADIHVSEESGMGRIAWHWKHALEERGYEYSHIGPNEVGHLPHGGLFPFAAHRAYRRLQRQKGKSPTFFLLHEAASGPFLDGPVPSAIFSHGLDRRSWELAKKRGREDLNFKNRLLFPMWRLRPCDRGIKKGHFLLFSNTEDIDFAGQYYGRKPEDIMVFRNGVNPLALTEQEQPKSDKVTVCFLASWLERKGIYVLIEAAKMLYERGIMAHWLLAGTGGNAEAVLNAWPEELRPSVEVIPKFVRDEEVDILRRTNIFVLPSFFEGQPLSLLQAMEAGRCCITTNCCGQRDLIQHGKNGLLYDPGNASVLAKLMGDCIQNELLRYRLGKYAKASVSDRHWATVSHEVVDRIEAHLALPSG
ncbi:MAG: glycosyltransferase family 4 protein [Cyanobacteria bacterium P01_F01_bin.150]